MVVVVVILVAIIVVVALVLGMRWYTRRAGGITRANESRADFQRELLLDLQDARDAADGELADAIDGLIDVAGHDTLASNEQTERLDAEIAEAAHELSERPTQEGVDRLGALLRRRNRRAVR